MRLTTSGPFDDDKAVAIDKLYLAFKLRGGGKPVQKMSKVTLGQVKGFCSKLVGEPLDSSRAFMLSFRR